ncbi:hypothetical protein YQE_05674, partial [Dendroctonus ponderosae]
MATFVMATKNFISNYLWPFQSQERKKKLKWNENVFVPYVMEAEEEEWDIQNRASWTPFQFFCQYFHDSFRDLMAEQSNIRALQDNKPPMCATASEYKKLVGSFIIMGCMKLPRIRMYYKINLQIPLATQIPRDRFFKFRNYMHLVDNLRVSEEKKKQNKLWKFQPAIDALLQNVYEQMISFTGTSSLRQYVKNEPNPVVPANVKHKLDSDKVLLRRGRGAFQELVREDNCMALTKWMDIRSVLVLSSSQGSQPVGDETTKNRINIL